MNTNKILERIIDHAGHIISIKLNSYSIDSSHSLISIFLRDTEDDLVESLTSSHIGIQKVRGHF